MNNRGNVPAVVGRGARGLRFHIEAGDLDAMDGLIPENYGVNMHDDGLALFLPRNGVMIGLNETPLTKAMAEGRFAEAEEMILEREDGNADEYLNDGAHIYTPLTLALTAGRSVTYQPRNLRLAKLLVQKGASVNLRIPNQDLERASESPLELLATFYLNLLKTFGLHGEGRFDDISENSAHRRQREYVEIDLLDTIGLENEEKMVPRELISQTKDLLYYFLSHGADINLQTADAGRTIFHVILTAEVSDKGLVEHMVTSLGALVNLTDVHGSTPLMDVIKTQVDQEAVDTYNRLSNLGKRLLLDAQNCSGESALFRSMFQGKMKMTKLLLDEGAASFIMARVQEDFQRKTSSPSRFTTYLYRHPCISTLPNLLSPLLGDSLCHRIASKRLGMATPKRFSVPVFNEIMRANIAPLVDLGWFCTREVEKTVHALLKAHTHFRHLTEERVFQEIAIIPLLFGHLTSGLRQRCLREILSMVLFREKGEKSAVLDNLFSKKSDKKSSSGSHHPRANSEPKEWRDVEPCDSACVIPSDSSEPRTFELSRVTLSEPEMSFSSTTPVNGNNPGEEAGEEGRARHSSTRQRRIGDNWLLQEDPHYQTHQFSQSSEGIELEISQNSEDDPANTSVAINDHSTGESERILGATGGRDPVESATKETVTRINRMLEETNDMLERLQTEVDTVNHDAEARALDKECGKVVGDMEQLAEDVEKQLGIQPGEEQESEDQALRSVPPVIIELQPTEAVGRSSEVAATSSNSTSSSSATSSPSSSYSTDDEDASWGGAFSLSHTLYGARSSSQNFFGRRGAEDSLSPSHEHIIKMFTRGKARLLANELGLAPGLLPCLELEIARLQLGYAVFRHRSIDCDRGCEGDDDSVTSSSVSDTSSWGPDSLTGPSLTDDESDPELESSLEDIESNLSFEPSVPQMPRILSESSSSSEDEEEDSDVIGSLPRHFNEPGRRQRRRGTPNRSDSEEDSAAPPLEDAAALPGSILREDWFSFEGGEAEQETTRRYVRQHLGRDFEDSTDSSTSSSDSLTDHDAGEL